MKVCEFTIDPPEVRAAKKREEEARLSQQLAEVERKLSSGQLVDETQEESQNEIEEVETIAQPDALSGLMEELEADNSPEIDPEIADLLED